MVTGSSPMDIPRDPTEEMKALSTSVETSPQTTLSPTTEMAGLRHASTPRTSPEMTSSLEPTEEIQAPTTLHEAPQSTKSPTTVIPGLEDSSTPPTSPEMTTIWSQTSPPMTLKPANPEHVTTRATPFTTTSDPSILTQTISTTRGERTNTDNNFDPGKRFTVAGIGITREQKCKMYQNYLIIVPGCSTVTEEASKTEQVTSTTQETNTNENKTRRDKAQHTRSMWFCSCHSLISCFTLHKFQDWTNRTLTREVSYGFPHYSSVCAWNFYFWPDHVSFSLPGLTEKLLTKIEPTHGPESGGEWKKILVNCGCFLKCKTFISHLVTWWFWKCVFRNTCFNSWKTFDSLWCFPHQFWRKCMPVGVQVSFLSKLPLSKENSLVFQKMCLEKLSLVQHYYREDDRIVCRTRPLLRDEDLWKPLQMGIKWTNLGIEETTDFTFTYKPDPVIQKITPNVSIIRYAFLNFVTNILPVDAFFSW